MPAAVVVSKTTLLASFAPRLAKAIVAFAGARNVSVPVPADQSALSAVLLVHEPAMVHAALPSTR